MLQRREDRREPPGPIEPAPSGVPSRPAVAPETDPRIEDYLDQIYAPLVGWVPYAARVELRAELQAHLASRVAAYQELGSSPDAAVREALAQSGDPQAVVREWVREWERILPRRKAPPAWYSTLVALGCFAVATKLGFGLIAAAVASGGPDGLPHVGQLGYPLFYAALAVLLPMLAGLTTGVLLRARAAQAVLAALVMLIPWAIYGLPSTGNPDFDSNSSLAEFAVLQGAFWIPIGCVSAALGGWLRGRREPAPKRRVLPA
jgi:hypothetical protein